MKAFLTGVALCAVIGIGAWVILAEVMDFSSATVYRNEPNSVRLDPGMGKRPGEG
ncbi:hypothetical protein [Breoghania sp. JC706]|uniref:hypothetical protein n=1 Tax=Breoghania sp. JC706 TaxID=3117732 RepID=UPI003008F308